MRKLEIYDKLILTDFTIQGLDKVSRTFPTDIKRSSLETIECSSHMMPAFETCNNRLQAFASCLAATKLFMCELKNDVMITECNVKELPKLSHHVNVIFGFPYLHQNFDVGLRLRV